MWNIPYHGNNHFNSIQSPKKPTHPSQHKMDMDHYQAYMQNALDDYQDDFTKLALLSHINGTPIPPQDINSIRATTSLIMLYIAVHLLTSDKVAISESRMKILLDQAEKMCYGISSGEIRTILSYLCSSSRSLVPHTVCHCVYKAELHATINRHCDSVLQLLKMSATIKPLPDLSTYYDKLWGASFPIISGLATLITNLGGEEISVQEHEILTHQAKDDALELRAASMPPKMPSPSPVIPTKCLATGNAPPPQAPQDPILPPGQIKTSLKTGKFHPLIASTPAPCQTNSTGADPDDKEDDPGIYSKIVEPSTGLEMEHI